MSDIEGQLALPERGIEQSSTPSPTIDHFFLWHIQQGTGTLDYRIPMHFTLLNAVAAPAGASAAGDYQTAVPGGVVLSVNGDMPIRFSDASRMFSFPLLGRKTGK
jgi:hypothetical protein